MISPMTLTILNWLRRAKRAHADGLDLPEVTAPPESPDLHNTNPLSPARLTIQIETALGPRTVITSAIPRGMASAIVEALAERSVLAAVHDDRGSHTVAELVRRKWAPAKRKSAVAASDWAAVQMRPAKTNISPIKRSKA